MSRVESIVKGHSPLDDYDERAARLPADDVDGWRSLGRWASQQGLSAQSRHAYEMVLTIAPDDPEARGALGFVLLNGRWMTEEESFRARGFVKHDGEWMTRAEAQMSQAAYDADQARQDAERRANRACRIGELELKREEKMTVAELAAVFGQWLAVLERVLEPTVYCEVLPELRRVTVGRVGERGATG